MKNNKEYLDKVVSIMEKPYFYNMENYGIDDIEEQEYVLGKIYDVNEYDIRVSDRGIYDIKLGYQIYYEGSCGYWSKKEFDKKGNMIYYQNSFDEIIDQR